MDATMTMEIDDYNDACEAKWQQRQERFERLRDQASLRETGDHWGSDADDDEENEQ